MEVHIDKDLPKLVEDKLQLHGITKGAAYLQALSGTYAKREMIVQYRESDLAFVARWLEHYGVFYFFEHLESGEVLHIGDAISAYLPAAEVVLGITTPVAFVQEAHHGGVFELIAIRNYLGYQNRVLSSQTTTLDYKRNALQQRLNALSTSIGI